MTDSTGTSKTTTPVLDEAAWLARLGPERFNVLRRGGTERAGTGELLHEHSDGTFTCGACDAPLFSSSAKYESGSGWPSFTDPLARESVELLEDTSHGMRRVEVRCAACHSHLGHVFPDGPGPTGERFCMNSLSLGFERS
jgi:peptide-methionine (R)-S-oxide reductase